METFTIEHLTFSYPEQKQNTLVDICLHIKTGSFVTLCGASGSGKTTLLRHLKPILTPQGRTEGRVLFHGSLLEDLDPRTQSSGIGFVQQNPDNQIVTDKVWHELAFGLESLGYSTAEIRLKTAEFASFFGIQQWFHQNISDLSGGQKQLLNLASIMVMSPSVLILDEPTSQLDPIAASDFLAAVAKVNRELGTTVLITEHRLEEVLPLSDQMLVMEAGCLISTGTPYEVGQNLHRKNHKLFAAMPTPMRVYGAVKVDKQLTCPVTLREGQNWLKRYHQKQPLQPIPVRITPALYTEPLVELDQVWFKYVQDGPDILKGLTLTAHSGEFLALVGGNGTGKSTALSLISGLNRPYRGTVRLKGRPLSEIPENERFHGLLGVLPQNPQALFVQKTVELDLYEMLKETNLPQPKKEQQILQVVQECNLEPYLQRHPYDLSGGEQQRLALAKVLLLEPRILLLDEPTKGMDAGFKQRFAAIQRRLLARQVCIIMVSHDLEFCAQYAHRCALLFDGSMVTEETPNKFFAGNAFYTTAANRMARQIVPEAVTAEELIQACGGSLPPEPLESTLDTESALSSEKNIPTLLAPQEPKPAKSSKTRFRIILAGLAVLLFGLVLLKGFPTLRIMAEEGFDLWQVTPQDSWSYALIMSSLALAVLLFCTALFAKRDRAQIRIPTARPKHRLEKRTLTAAMMIVLLIPLTLFIGYSYFGDRKYLFISLLVLLETMLPFFLIFEGRKPQARELVTISVLCALTVAGRAAFFMVPQFKPVVAMVIISGVALGAETGFLVGAVTALVSNFFFGQGPWTPWQMLAFGIIGFLAGILFRKGFFLRSRVLLAVFGGLSTLFIYGLIMNTYATLAYQANPSWPMFLTHMVSGLPFDLIHALSTVFFLLLLAKPLLEKLDRIKSKYSLVESDKTK